ncbi:hypothetical protein BC828DRAFT_384098 [Blastocladiella britannica]|nr:hypothetical protein BC828DRAFT_384098 [Blastocladiella britannica]
MQSTLLALAALALCASAVQVQLNTPTGTWKAGSTVAITWTSNPADTAVPAGTVGQLVLMKVNGNPNNMTPVQTLGNAAAEQGTFNWQIPAGIANAADYAIQWQWANQPTSTYKYTGQIAIQGGSGTLTASTATTSASASTSGSATATRTTSTTTLTVVVTPTAIPTASVKLGNAAAPTGAPKWGVAAAMVAAAAAAAL